MLDKNLVKELYKQGWAYSEIAREYGVTRQRIHQIVRNYKNHGKDGRLKKYRNFGKCEICKEKAIVLHHRDFNNSHDNVKNLQPLCGKCHLLKHKGRKREYKEIHYVLKGWWRKNKKGVKYFLPYKEPKIIKRTPR